MAAIADLQTQIEDLESEIDSLREQRADEAIDLWQSGHSLRDIADAIGLSHSAVAKMINAGT